jgi:hypothetical protein
MKMGATIINWQSYLMQNKVLLDWMKLESGEKPGGFPYCLWRGLNNGMDSRVSFSSFK